MRGALRWRSHLTTLCRRRQTLTLRALTLLWGKGLTDISDKIENILERRRPTTCGCER